MKIAVLLSSYNGEKYISEQIHSILNQKIDTEIYSLKLYVRDDGSQDRTTSIVKKLQEQYDNLVLFEDGKNLGFAKSFLSLLYKVNADYYFFSDQDDVWTVNKLSVFMGEFERKEKDNPIMGVFSDAWIADKNANSTGKSLLFERKKRISTDSLEFEQQLFDSFVAGASLAFNKRVKLLTEKIDFKLMPDEEAHDYFIALIISCYGKLFFVDVPTLYYRQFGDNVYGARDTSSQSLLFKVKALRKRTADVKKSMYAGTIISKSLSGNNKIDWTNEMLDVVLGKVTYLHRINFFLNFGKYVSPKHPILLPILYGMLMSKGKTDL